MRKGSKIAAFRGSWLLALLVAVGCAPKLGDSCKNNTDCSVQGDRSCDLSSPGGYCTIPDCVEGGCKDEGFCIRFEPDQLRLASSWCMSKCRRGCRDGYRCTTVDEINAEQCGMCGAEYTRLDELGVEGREEEPEDVRAEWARVRLCINTQPRGAELLEDRASAHFCAQEVQECVEEE